MLTTKEDVLDEFERICVAIATRKHEADAYELALLRTEIRNEILRLFNINQPARYEALEAVAADAESAMSCYEFCPLCSKPMAGENHCVDWCPNNKLQTSLATLAALDTEAGDD